MPRQMPAPNARWRLSTFASVTHCQKTEAFVCVAIILARDNRELLSVRRFTKVQIVRNTSSNQAASSLPKLDALRGVKRVLKAHALLLGIIMATKTSARRVIRPRPTLRLVASMNLRFASNHTISLSVATLVDGKLTHKSIISTARLQGAASLQFRLTWKLLD